MEIVSWNINGIRSLAKSIKKPLGKFFQYDLKHPQIICFQETKVSSYADLSDDLAMVDGYESYWSFSRTKKGYSGVVTYVKKGPSSKSFCKDAMEGFGDAAFSQEGRVVMTDHGSFVLFNVYFPNGGQGKDRLDYKMKFYASFESRCRTLIAAGRRVVVVGDVNTAHREIDIHDPKSNCKRSGFLPLEREWMDKLLAEDETELDKPFIDSFRRLHPGAVGQYTFWDSKSSARDRNKGWRIDYALVSRDLWTEVTRAEISSDVMGSDHCPVTLSLKAQAGVTLSPDAPAMCAKYQTKFFKKQSMLSKFFGKPKPPSASPVVPTPSANATITTTATITTATTTAPAGADAGAEPKPGAASPPAASSSSSSSPHAATNTKKRKSGTLPLRSGAARSSFFGKVPKLKAGVE